MLGLVSLLNNYWGSYCYFYPTSLCLSLFCVTVCLGLLYAGDKLVEVNGVSVEGLDPEQVIHILVNLFAFLLMICINAKAELGPSSLCVCTGMYRGLEFSWQLSPSRLPDLVCHPCHLLTSLLYPEKFWSCLENSPSQVAPSFFSHGKTARAPSPAPSSPGLLHWKLSLGWTEWDFVGESEPEQTTPSPTNTFLQLKCLTSSWRAALGE